MCGVNSVIRRSRYIYNLIFVVHSVCKWGLSVKMSRKHGMAIGTLFTYLTTSGWGPRPTRELLSCNNCILSDFLARWILCKFYSMHLLTHHMMLLLMLYRSCSVKSCSNNLCHRLLFFIMMSWDFFQFRRHKCMSMSLNKGVRGPEGFFFPWTASKRRGQAKLVYIYCLLPPILNTGIDEDRRAYSLLHCY